MRLIKIALCSVNATVGSVKSNVDRCVRLATEAARDGATVAAFPEQVVGGYSPEDLVQWHGFVEAQWRELSRFGRETAALDPVFILGVTVGAGGHLYNAVAVVHRGAVLGVVPKEKLPTYGVFYEARTFSPGAPGLSGNVAGVPFGDLVFAFDFGTLGVEVCEDAWSPDGPLRRRSYAGAELIVNVSASPFRMGVMGTRREMLATRSADNQCTLAYVNLVGANDGLVFDGGGFVHQNGRPALEAPRFREGLASVVVDLDRTRRLRTENTTWRRDCQQALEQVARPTVVECTGRTADRTALAYPFPPHRSFFLPGAAARRTAREEFAEDLLDALSTGVGDYLEKTGAFRGLGIALSGGRDSLLTLLVAWRYLQRRLADLSETERRAKVGALMHAFYMPTRFSSDHTQKSAQRISDDLGVPLKVVPIEEAFKREADAAREMVGGDLTPVTMQNVQARIRGQRMWNWANTTGMLFLQTGNMSEKAMGYTTIGGDLEGALAVLANVPKTVVIFLLEYLLEKHGFEGIRMTLAAPAGPELAANQKGEDELMPFPVLDSCFYLYAAEKLSPAEMTPVLCTMFPEFDRAQVDAWVTRFTRLFVQSIYKWVQAPLSLHVGNLDLDRERALQLPVVETTEWTR
ncbi:MAG: NAD(+) synthase [Deltaproteobacteria bacterium]|nr:NAD(+) synthase [Deltaproteobacteria bacterium]